MRAYLAGSLLCVASLSGCLGSKDDQGASAPNYNPAAEREDYPEPAGSDSRPSDATPGGAVESGDASAPPQPSDNNRVDPDIAVPPGQPE